MSDRIRPGSGHDTHSRRSCQCSRSTRRHCYEIRHDITSRATMTQGAASPDVDRHKPKRTLRDKTWPHQQTKSDTKKPTKGRRRTTEESTDIHCTTRRSTAGIEKMTWISAVSGASPPENRPPVVIPGLLLFTAASGVCLDRSTHTSFARVKVVIQRTVSVHVCLFVRVFSYTISFSALPTSSS